MKLTDFPSALVVLEDKGIKYKLGPKETHSACEKNNVAGKTTKIPDKAHLLMRIFDGANIWESMHVPGRAEQIFRQNQRVTTKFKKYTFLVEKKQCKQILLQHFTQKISTTLLWKATTVLGPNCSKQHIHKTESRGLCTKSPQTIYRKIPFHVKIFLKTLQ